MINAFSAPVLAVAADAVRDLEGGDALSGLWTLFTKCKESLKDGRRLENISWRLWYREMAAAQSYRPLTPDNSSPAQLEAGQDFPFFVAEQPPTHRNASHEETTQRFTSAPSYTPGQLHNLASPTSPSERSSTLSPSHSSNFSISISRPKSSPSVGKFIVDMLPNSAIEPMRSPGSAKGLLSPCSDSREIIEPHKYVTLPAVCLPSSPPLSDSAPRVVVVNPTPHPTPPATPILNHSSSAANHTPLRSTHLLPPLPSPALMSVPSSNQSRPEARLSPPRSLRASNTADETLKASDRRFFLQHSPERISPDIDGSVDEGKVIAADTVEASSGGSSQMQMKGSAESNRPVVMKRKGKEASRHVGAVRPGIRRGQSSKGPVKRQASTDGAKVHRPTFNIGSSSSHASKTAKDVPAPLAQVVAPPPPPPPPPAVKAPAPKKRTQSPIKPAITQTAKGRRVVVASSASDSDYETDTDDDSWCSEDLSAVEEKTAKETKEEIRLKEAALEAQRQRDMFAKVPKRSYSNLDRTRSGLLSALLNPDPKIFPANHPYRTSHSTQDMTQLPRRGHTLSNLAPMAPLSSSKSAVALPHAVQATVRAPPSGLTEALSKGQVEGGYQPKGRPHGQEMDSDSEDDNPDDKIQVSKSVAQERLAALAGRRGIDRSQSSRPPSQPAPSRPSLPTITSAPIPFGHPYNLPAPSAPSTPRTTRRQMLSTELSESLRRNLLWERQVSKNVMVGQRRQSATVLGGNGLRPMTTLAPGESSRNGHGNNTALSEATERAETKRRAMARNRSWADDYDYHTSGW